MTEQLKIYDVGTDTMREATQYDIDRLRKVATIQGFFINAVRRAFDEYERKKNEIK